MKEEYVEGLDDDIVYDAYVKQESESGQDEDHDDQEDRSDSDSESDDEDDSHNGSDEISQEDEKYDSNEEDHKELEESLTHRHNLRRNPKPSYKYKYVMNATILGEFDESVYKPGD